MKSNQQESADQQLTIFERRESQLWLLAVLVVCLLACTVIAIDWTATLPLQDSDSLSVPLDSKIVRLALLTSVLVISAYFRDTSRRLRRINHQLVMDLQERTDELQRKNVEINKLKDLSDQLINLTDLPKALDLALDMAVDVTGADSASIMLRDRGSDILTVVAARGLPEGVVGKATVRMGEGLSGVVAESGDAAILNSDDLAGKMRTRAHRTDELVSAIIVPVKIDSEIRGVINVSRKRGGLPFSGSDLRVFSTLANQSALVLRKIELWADLQEQVVMLEQALEDLKRAQNELVQTEKLASIGQLSGGMAHEINNPLQVITGRLELLLQKAPAGSDEARQLAIIADHTERISTIVSSLLRFSRRQPEDTQDKVPVDDALRDAGRFLTNHLTADNISLVSDLNCGDASVIGSRVKIQQIFMNLMINAYQAMRIAGGELRIHSEVRQGEILVTVADTGPGISPENLPKIFEPFFTTKPEGEGTGLGLSVTYGIVTSHGGRISVTSEIGAGAVFSVSLPMSLPEPKQQVA